MTSARLWLTAAVFVILAVASAAVWTSDSLGSPSSQGSSIGASLFRSKGCIGCHNGPGATSAFSIGPDLNDLRNVAGERVDGLDAVEYVSQSIREPQAFLVPGFTFQMPTIPLESGEIDQLVEYLLGAA